MKISIAVCIVASSSIIDGVTAFAPMAATLSNPKAALLTTQLDMVTSDETNGKSHTKRKIALKVSERTLKFRLKLIPYLRLFVSQPFKDTG